MRFEVSVIERPMLHPSEYLAELEWLFGTIQISTAERQNSHPMCQTCSGAPRAVVTLGMIASHPYACLEKVHIPPPTLPLRLRLLATETTHTATIAMTTMAE